MSVSTHVARIVFGLSAVLSGGLAHTTRERGPEQTRPLTVADTVEIRRILARPGKPAIKLSPNRDRYAVAIVQGDLQSNGTWLELLSGGTGSLEDARPATVARLFTKSTGQIRPTHLVEHRIEWLDDDRLALLWNAGDGAANQLWAVDVRSRTVEALTQHATDVIHFDAGMPANTVLVTAMTPHSTRRSAELLRDGFAVKNRSAFTLLLGDVDGWQQWSSFDTFLIDLEERTSRQVVVNGVGPDRRIRAVSRFSPDGERIIVDGQPAAIPREWDAYRDDILLRGMREAREDPAAPADVWQLFVIDARLGTSRPLWAAPMMPYANVVWSPDSRRVVIAPTFLPVAAADAAGLRGQAAAVVDVTTGDYETVPLPMAPDVPFWSAPRALSWSPRDEVAIGNDDVTFRFKRAESGWYLLGKGQPGPVEGRAMGVRIEVRQSPSSPPVIVGVDSRSGAERTLLDVNPGLRTGYELGSVSEVSWKDRHERTWQGVLYHPVKFSRGRRYPLVIQTHGFNAGEFSLLGNESLTSNNAAQPLANREMFVLQMQDPHEIVPAVLASPEEPKLALEGMESAIEHLSAEGLVDAARVGLVGFSRTGWHVLYALTHSEFPFAAATVADNIDGGYFQAGLHWGWTGEFAQDNGDQPFGAGLRRWMENSPAFNAEKVRTPLRMQVDSGGIPFVVISAWEMFSRLRALHKPVELYVVPDIQHGVHGMVIPAQQLASRQGVVDWMDFWLNDHENPQALDASNPETRRTQYERWRVLARRTNRKNPQPQP